MIALYRPCLLDIEVGTRLRAPDGREYLIVGAGACRVSLINVTTGQWRCWADFTFTGGASMDEAMTRIIDEAKRLNLSLLDGTPVRALEPKTVPATIGDIIAKEGGEPLLIVNTGYLHYSLVGASGLGCGYRINEPVQLSQLYSHGEAITRGDFSRLTGTPPGEQWFKLTSLNDLMKKESPA